MAIAATIQGEHWDVLDLRFPLAFEGPLRAQAEATALPPAGSSPSPDRKAPS